MLEVENPYKGLRAFSEADAADFFGRAALVGRLLERMAGEGALTPQPPLPAAGEGEQMLPFTSSWGDGERFLAVVGPSGSGKSSVVRAGLIPALRQGGLSGSEQWFIADLMPGTHPLEELELALLKVAVRQPADLAEQLGRDARGLLRAARLILPDENSELLLVIDQFEEVFTLVAHEAARMHFLDNLATAATDPRSRVRVVATLRADFYDRPLAYPQLGALIRERTEVVLPLSTDELALAIVAPARRARVMVEPDLVADIVRDVGTQPGALPLLQYALTELFERREGRVLTRAAYRASGGMSGALARRAEELYQGLDPAGQDAARQLFLRLVMLGEGVEDTRRRVRISEFGVRSSGAEARIPNSMQQVIDRFSQARLLTFDRDAATRAPTAEVAHEALLRAWGRLREWLDTSRAALRTQRQLTAAAAEWTEHAQDTSYLASGARLAQFAALAEGGAIMLNAAEQAYLDASLAERDRQAREEHERQATELEQAQALAEEQRGRAEAAHHAEAAQRSAAQRLRALVGALVIFFLVAGGLALYAFGQQREAERQARQANVRAWSAAALNNLETDPERSLLLILQAVSATYNVDRSILPEAEDALRRSLQRAKIKRRLETRGRFSWLDWSADGQRIAIQTHTPFRDFGQRLENRSHSRDRSVAGCVRSHQRACRSSTAIIPTRDEHHHCPE
jgi:hypothetical protein